MEARAVQFYIDAAAAMSEVSFEDRFSAKGRLASNLRFAAQHVLDFLGHIREARKRDIPSDQVPKIWPLGKLEGNAKIARDFHFNQTITKGLA